MTKDITPPECLGEMSPVGKSRAELLTPAAGKGSVLPVQAAPWSKTAAYNKNRLPEHAMKKDNDYPRPTFFIIRLKHTWKYSVKLL